jgi:hypothetical protein
MIYKNDMKQASKNRRINKEFQDLTSGINIAATKQPQQLKKLSRSQNREIKSFLDSIDGQPLKTELLIFDNHIEKTFHCKILKAGSRQFDINTSSFTKNQFLELFINCL